MERIPHWYSVIRYCPDSIRGESLNVGLIVHNPSDGKFKFSILESSNKKLRSLLANEVSLKTYEVQKDLFEYYLQQIPENTTLLDPDNYTNNFLEDLNNEFTNKFIVSEPTFSKSSDPERLFDHLLKTYVGEEFLNAIDNSQEISIKRYVKEYFDDRKLINTKVKSNVKIKPIKDVKNMHFTIDFVYKNGVLNFLQALPSNEERLTEWFAKTNTVLNIFQRESGFYIFYNKDDQLNADGTVDQMLNYFSEKDSRVINLDINSKAFDELTQKIAREGQGIKEIDAELIAM